ncbi:hypothetical protein LLG46_15645 [bacterium]|nr:hypothetical protein [bacterium]
MSRYTARITILLGLSVVIVCIGIAAYFTWPFLTTGSRVRNEIANIKASGEPVCRADMEVNRLPGCQNAADVYIKAFKLISQHYKSQDFATLRQLIKPMNGTRDTRPWAESKPIVDKYEEVFDLISQADKIDYCRFPLGWKEGLFPDTSMCQGMRNLATLTTARAILSAREGSMDKAGCNIESSLKMAASFSNEPALIPFLARIALIKMGTGAIYSALDYGSFSEAQTQRLMKLLSSNDLNTGYTHALITERAVGINKFYDLSRLSVGADHNTDIKSKKPSQVMRIIFSLDEKCYLDLMNKEIKNAGLSYRQAKQKGLLTQHLPRYAITTSIMIPLYVRIRIVRDTGIVSIDGAKIILMLESFRRKYGRYPLSLNELRQKLRVVLPKDIFSGNDFVYRPNGSGFLLYSIGEDLKDDGGKPVGSNKKSPKLGDYSWELRR